MTSPRVANIPTIQAAIERTTMLIRRLEANGAPKPDIDAEARRLLALKRCLPWKRTR